jgi:hypothetical protein
MGACLTPNAERDDRTDASSEFVVDGVMEGWHLHSTEVKFNSHVFVNHVLDMFVFCCRPLPRFVSIFIFCKFDFVDDLLYTQVASFFG